jgi:predicted PurR-regulated permease PerM
LVINIAVNQAIEFSDDISSFVAGNNTSATDIIDRINQLLADIPYASAYRITEADIVNVIQRIAQPVATFLGQNALSLGGDAAQLITRFIIFLALLAALFPAFPGLIQIIKELSPLDDVLDQKYLDRVIAMTKAMVKGVFVIAIVQGLAAGLLFAIAGVRYSIFWTLLSILLAVLPLGVNAIAIPIGIVMLSLGNIWQGILILAGSVFIVSNLDNLLRPRLVSKEAVLNPALVLLSAFGGLNLFGFMGVIYGPVVMIFLITTIEIYLEHYQLTEAEP